MRFRQLITLIFALLATVGLAAGITAGIQVLMPLITIEWIGLRWLISLSLLTALLPSTILAVWTYCRRRARRMGQRQG
jgi:hypothetical protein